MEPMCPRTSTLYRTLGLEVGLYTLSIIFFCDLKVIKSYSLLYCAFGVVLHLSNLTHLNDFHNGGENTFFHGSPSHRVLLVIALLYGGRDLLVF